MIEFPRKLYLSKYERFENRRTRIKAHVPPCLTIAKGDTIKIIESRPISKTKNFVAVEVVKK
jgi:small subunit ribosomal protein S17